MATDPDSLLSEAKCYMCYASNAYTLGLMELALLAQIVAGGGGGGGGGDAMTFGAYGAGDSIPTDGSITTQAAWNTDTDHVFWNTAWPDTASPTWAQH